MRVSCCLLFLALAGCAHGVMDVTSGQDGVHYRLEGANMTVSDAPGGGVLLHKDGHELKSVAGRLALDGRDVGPVSAGDRVVFTRDDRVYVNAVERTAAPEAP